jgi:hypothetical protein
MKHLLALSCLLPGFCLLLACKPDASQPSGNEPAAVTASAPAKQSYDDEKGVPSGTSLIDGLSREGSGQITDIRDAISITSATVSNRAEQLKLPADLLNVHIFLSNHTGKVPTAIELRISLFDASGLLLTKRVIKKDDADPMAKDDIGDRYRLGAISESMFFVSTDYLSELSLMRQPMLIQLGDPLPAREFDDIAQALLKSSIRIRVEPLTVTYRDGTVLTGVR